MKQLSLGGIISILILCLLSSCSSSSMRLNNMSYIYGRNLVIHPDFKVYQGLGDTAYIYFKINTDNLLYSRVNKDSEFQASIKVNWETYYQLSDKLPIQRDSAIYLDRDNEQIAKDLIGRLKVVQYSQKDLLAKVTIQDVNRNTQEVRIIRVIGNPDLKDRQGFLITDANTGVPVVSKFLQGEDSLRVYYRKGSIKNINLFTLGASGYIAKAPFDITPSGNDELPAIQTELLENENGGFSLKLGTDPGVYFFQADTSNSTGSSLYRFENGFPTVTTGEQLVGPLRYLCSDEEFNELKLSSNKKIAAENFWIKRCGGRERAREVIRAFYSRVEEANEYFTSYKEGWKTDRGMIYIIFGPPDGLYVNNGSESWVYGQDANMMSLSLNFKRKENPFSDNEFELDRNSIYRTFWYTAVEYWRTGQVFTL